MTVELRIYKRFDQDLMALKMRGADLPNLVRKTLYSFARGRRIYFRLPNDVAVNLNDRKSFHLRVYISDSESIKLLNAVKPSYRNSFCKALLREAFVFQNLGVFLVDDKYAQIRSAHFEDIPAEANLCELTKKHNVLHVAEKKTLNAQLKYKGYIGSAAFIEEKSCYSGKILGISDNISYEGKTIEELTKNFHAAVNDYVTSLNKGSRSSFAQVSSEKENSPIGEIKSLDIKKAFNDLIF